jgi:hypothetical protein
MVAGVLLWRETTNSRLSVRFQPASSARRGEINHLLEEAEHEGEVRLEGDRHGAPLE